MGSPLSSRGEVTYGRTHTCPSRRPGTYIFGCRLCNYDLCQACAGVPRDPQEHRLYLHRLLESVAKRLPTVSWKSPGIAEAMKACVDLMPPGTLSPRVVDFLCTSLFQVVWIMVNLDSIEGDPANMTDLQAMWKARSFTKFNLAFHDTLSCTVRVLLRLARVYTPSQLMNLSFQVTPTHPHMPQSFSPELFLLPFLYH